MATGRKMSEMAMIMPVLAVTEPMALPIAISVLPSAAAMVETMISGSVVAMDTTVAPIRNCGRPEASAIHVAASTNQSPPLTINASPSRNSKIVIMSDDDIRIPPCISQKDEKKDLLHTMCKKSRSCFQAQGHRKTGRLLAVRL